MFQKKERRFFDGKPIDPADPATTVLAEGATVEGDLDTPGDAIVCGNVHGALRAAGRLHLRSGATVRGAVSAGEAKIDGSVEGPVTVSGKLEIGQAARVLGDLRAGNLAIAEGSLVRGNLQAEAPTHRFVERREPSVAEGKETQAEVEA